ncbi:MAG TPA: hypothetical protein VFT08_00840, partial [Pyrinomonadaceae bacterium]|nr:hypothetical protein [Pyrinomonadaceae bacterium]
VSDCYGRKRQSVACAFSATIGPGQDVISFLLPGVECDIEEIEAGGGRAFRVKGKNGIDVLMIRADGQIETENLISDFEITWARFAETGAQKPVEIVAIKGSSVQYRGETMIGFDSEVDFATL